MAHTIPYWQDSNLPNKKMIEGKLFVILFFYAVLVEQTRLELEYSTGNYVLLKLLFHIAEPNQTASVD